MQVGQIWRYGEVGDGEVVNRYVVGGADKVKNVAAVLGGEVGKFMCCVKLKPFSISVKSVNIDVVESRWSLQGGAWMGRWRTTQAEQQEG